MFDDTGGYLQKMVVLKRNMMTNPIFRCNQLLDLSLPSVQNSGPSWRDVSCFILFFSFSPYNPFHSLSNNCRPATKKTSRSAFRCTRAEIKRATCLSCLTQSWCHHRPWTCHGPAGHATAQTPTSTNRFHLLETWESSRTRRTRSRLAPL